VRAALPDRRFVRTITACLVAGGALVPATGSTAALPETIRIARASIAYEDLTVRLERVEAIVRPDQPIALSVSRIAGPAGTLPLWGSARLREDAAGWRASGVVASGAGDVVARFEGSGLGGTAPQLRLATEPITFAPGGLQPERLWQPLGAVARDARGTLSATLEWPDGPIAGRITLDRLWPPRTAEPQHVIVEGLHLAPLVEGFEIAALGAEGTIDADLRFSFTEKGRAFIDEGRLVARGPGVLRYRAAEPPPMLAGQGQGVELLFTALADFRYQSLTAIVRGYLDADLTVELQLRGSNPELYEGYPIELNVNLEAPIMPLALAGREALALPDAVRRALEPQP
jgi:hypothetical protein